MYYSILPIKFNNGILNYLQIYIQYDKKIKAVFLDYINLILFRLSILYIFVIILALSSDNNAQNQSEKIDEFKLKLINPKLLIDSPSELKHSYEIGSITSDIPLAPDPNAAGASFGIIGDPGHYAVRSCDLVLDDNTDFNQPVAITSNPIIMRALFPYDADMDKGYDYDDTYTKETRLTRANTTSRLTSYDNLQNVIERDNNLNDDVLFIDLGVFYDDNETDDPGGFWANWRITVYPLKYINNSWSRQFAKFQIKFRGPFWSGEKLEVGDTDDGFLPQIMYYENFGIWNWQWQDANGDIFGAVEIVIEEGDAGWWDDLIARIVVRKDESTNNKLIIADTGDLVKLYLTDDYKFKRVVVDNSKIDHENRPRIIENPDGHDVDVSFHTKKLTKIEPSISRYFVGPERVKGPSVSDEFDWKDAVVLGNKELKYIDNISYTPGWDCGIVFGDPDADFSFSIKPDNPNLNKVLVETSLGGCEDRTTLFFRANRVYLPEYVIIRQSSIITVSNNSSETIRYPYTNGYIGRVFTELLAYETNGADLFGFKINKDELGGNYTVTAEAFNGDNDSFIQLRIIVIEWPVSEVVNTTSHTLNTQNAQYGTAHLSTDIEISNPNIPYFIINETLVYSPALDLNMSWGLYYEPLQSHVNFQLSSGNSYDPNGYVKSEGTILQFRTQNTIARTFVDINYNGFENGTELYPWNTIQEGINWISPGGEVLIKPGVYLENINTIKECKLLRNGNSGKVVIGD